MDLSEFDFTLPPDRIAQHPARPREQARLLAVGADSGRPDVADLPDLLAPGDILVGNDTRVFPGQLRAWRGEARIGVTLDRPRPTAVGTRSPATRRGCGSGDVLRFEPPQTAGPARTLTAEVTGGGADGSIDPGVQPGRRRVAAGARAGPGRSPCRPISHRPDGPTAADAAGLSDRVRPAPRAPSPPRPPGCISPRPAGGAGRAGCAPRHGHPPCRDRHLPAGAGGAGERPRDARGTRRNHRRRRRGDQSGPTRRRPGGCRRHDRLRLLESAALPDGTIRPFARGNRAVHPARLPVQARSIGC